MHRYRVQAPITLHAGVIGLNKDTAAVRARFLEPRQQRGTYFIVGRIQFKAGERIRLDPAAAKTFGSALIDIDAETAG